MSAPFCLRFVDAATQKMMMPIVLWTSFRDAIIFHRGPPVAVAELWESTPVWSADASVSSCLLTTFSFYKFLITSDCPLPSPHRPSTFFLLRTILIPFRSSRGSASSFRLSNPPETSVISSYAHRSLQRNNGCSLSLSLSRPPFRTRTNCIFLLSEFPFNVFTCLFFWLPSHWL